MRVLLRVSMDYIGVLYKHYYYINITTTIHTLYIHTAHHYTNLAYVDYLILTAQ